MKSKFAAVFFVLLMGTFSMTSSAGAYSVTLDSVKNAGWSDNILGSSYLYIQTGEGAWVDSSTRPWDNFGTMVADLADGVINAGGSEISVGAYTLYSGGDVFNSDPADKIYKSLSLTAGHYRINLAPGSDIYDLTGYSDASYNPDGSDLWNAYVQIWGSGGQGFAFGGGESASSNISAMLASLTSISLFLAQDTTLYFYINDTNALDNTGSVTLDITAVPEPGTLLLLGAGMLSMAAAGRAFRKTGKS